MSASEDETAAATSAEGSNVHGILRVLAVAGLLFVLGRAVTHALLFSEQLIRLAVGQ